MVFVIIAICLILVALVILLMDALINDSDAVTNAPGVGMEAVERATTGDYERTNTTPLAYRPAGKTQQPEPPTPAPDSPTLEESESRLTRLMRDQELRKIPPMVFSEIIQDRGDGKKSIVLFPRGPMPLFIPPGPEESIVNQIDDILQKNIAGTPLAQREVRMIESPTKGVLVKVGPLYFDEVDTVTDPEVKAAVQAAVAEWEAEQ